MLRLRFDCSRLTLSLFPAFSSREARLFALAGGPYGPQWTRLCRLVRALELVKLPLGRVLVRREQECFA